MLNEQMQQILAFPQLQSALNLRGDIRSDAEDACNRAVRSGDWILAIVDPMDRSILRRQLLHLVHALVLGDGLGFQLIRQIGDRFGINAVVRLSHQPVGVFQSLRQQRDRAAGRQDHVISIFDVNVIVRVSDESFETLQQKSIAGLDHGSRVFEGQLQDHVVAGAGRFLREARLSRSECGRWRDAAGR